VRSRSLDESAFEKMTHVLIRGDGAAASTCAHLLRSAGCRVTFERKDRLRPPAIMLTEAALSLLRDVFRRPDLFRDSPRIRQRMVIWGKQKQPYEFDHRAVVVSEEALLHGLQSPFENEVADRDCDWTICSALPLPSPAVEHRFGSRTAAAAKIELKDGSSPETCWTESHEHGWLFLIPDGAGSGWLLSAGSTVEQALGNSRLVASQVTRVTKSAGEFFAGPRVSAPLCGPAWMACGTAAIAFDPLCGDGTANAVREAILASAVIRSAARGGNATELLSLYSSRLIAGFQRHLAQCYEFYRTAREGPWWDSELDALAQGLRWSAGQLHPQPATQYRLNGFELEALA
jgi:2-polyprenyl-6-methoxyphenol hydroxylase-like FAD-dependent oxidoreductase